MDALKSKAQSLGFWNLFLPHELPEMYLTNREYGILCEVMGRSSLAPEACNCSAPDTGNMEVLLKHGTQSQQLKYLLPLLRGEVRSAFLMTEPDVASSDARNLETRLSKRMDDGGSVRYTLNGKKWWSTGAMDPRCRMALVVTKMDYTHPSNANNAQQQTQTKTKHGNQTVVIVPMPQTGVRCVRPLTVFGYDDAPHGHAEVWLESVDLGMESVVLGEGRGFEISQSRLGPGRIHHCMRAVGLAARCYELMLERTFQRKTFGRFLYEHGSCREMVADSAADIESARLLTLSCAEEIDRLGARGARDKIALIKVVVPELTSRVVDRAVQVFGGAGVCGDFPLARALVGLRTLRIADGPDAVHKQSLALLELKKAKQRMLSRV
ncbi:ACYL-COA dehydrogenase [Thalassiosira pseudonana CCMP1335]|uniref:ACYL-COA dehydrogenase n=1 Tax=Thalassiosira pseudonana TaxID=35128 RepID=B8LE08_THAPS|nr:ACYL-COA dehydrogenase [Thalassiosira pseudonana CCMP1335]EED86410.1 ACYL-COA dehydrogenase [Thalassiosira pseudonana CCMP1335]